MCHHTGKTRVVSTSVTQGKIPGELLPKQGKENQVYLKTKWLCGIDELTSYHCFNFSVSVLPATCRLPYSNLNFKTKNKKQKNLAHLMQHIRQAKAGGPQGEQVVRTASPGF